MSRIQTTFSKLRKANKCALIPFITAGDPEPRLTVPIMHTLVASGADILELGVPFSDPMADGSVIQRSSARALAKGVNLSQILVDVQTFRQTNTTTPVVLMGYANPIESFGLESFAQSAQQAGVDGVLVVDYPPEEALTFATLLKQQTIDPIFLLAPTSTEIRIKQLQQLARGYIYYVSLLGVTGSAALDIDSVTQCVAAIKQHLSLPIAVGFGIRDAQTAQAIGKIADAVVIGSRLVQLLESVADVEGLSVLVHFIKQIRNALDEVV